jgi:hypothetical protein
LQTTSHKKNQPYKTKISTITLILVLALPTFALVALAKTYTAMPDRETGTVVGASPQLVGLGQDVLINIMTYPAPSGPTYFAQDMVGGLTGGFSNISVTITHPDDSKETLMPIDTSLEHAGLRIPGQQQIVGHLQFIYKPTTIGNYSVTASFPGKTYTTDGQYANLNLSVYYKPSASKVPATFTVQEEPVLGGILNGYPWSPLPSGYWTNPVFTDNREWAPISGAWVQGVGSLAQYISKYNPYSTAPNTPHIIWARQVSSGGLVGGPWQSLPLGGGGGAGNIILDGKIYQPDPYNTSYFECVDLRTGQKLWSVPGSVTVAWHIDPWYQTAAQSNEGAITEYLWGTSGTNWIAYNPFNGAVARTLTNAPSDAITIDWADGSDIVWVTQAGGFNTTRPLGYAYLNLIKWNYTKCTVKGLYQQGSNWRDGIVWNVSAILPNGEVSPGDTAQGYSTQNANGAGFRAFPFPGANVVIAKSHNAMQVMLGFDMDTGTLLWKNNQTVLDIGVRDPDGGPNGPIFLHDGATQTLVAYDVKTGRELYKATAGEAPWATIPDYCYVINVEKRIMYYGSFDGHVYAINVDTGKPIWTSDYMGDDTQETIYGHQPLNGGGIGADGKVYFSSTTVYSMMPRPRFHEIVAINETTGKFVWRLPLNINPTAIAYGYMIGTDTEDGIQYGFGKGLTTTTVSIQNDVISKGLNTLIKGTVMDMSPGKPNTPAVSEADMSEWMDYLYGQNATLINNPPKPEGVTVRLAAVDSSGNVIDLGTTTSDSTGQFAIAWKPSTEDTYKIYATYDGSESYWGSYAGTALSVETATDTSPTQPQQSPPDYTMTIIGAAIAVIIAVAIVGLLIFLALRKR